MTKQFGSAGPRALYPDIARSRSLRRCGALANALFPRLIPLSDDQGRGQGDAADIANVTGIVLIRDADLPSALVAVAELEAAGMVQMYEAEGEPYWQIVGWWAWQGPSQRRAYASRHPAPPGWVDLVYGDGDGQPTTWRAAAGMPPGKPGPRGQGPATVPGLVPGTDPGTDPGIVRTSLAGPGPAEPSHAVPGPAVAHTREAQPPAGSAEAPPPAGPADDKPFHERVPPPRGYRQPKVPA